MGWQRKTKRVRGEHVTLRLTFPVTSVCVVDLSVTDFFCCASLTAGADRAHCGDWLLADKEGGTEVAVIVVAMFVVCVCVCEK